MKPLPPEHQPPKVKKVSSGFRLTTLSNTRRTFAKILKQYANEEITSEKAKTLTYMFNTYTQMFKIESELSFEERLQKLEENLRGQNENN